MLAAVAVVLMCIGTILPVATYAAPVLCMLVGQTVRKLCGSGTAWAWYGVVTVLSLLMAPDKEAAAVFAVLGYYPIIKPKLDKTRGKWLWKGLLFNGSILLLYWLLLNLLGIDQLVSEFAELGGILTAVLLVMGNVTFFLLDRVLEMRPKQRKKG